MGSLSGNTDRVCRVAAGSTPSHHVARECQLEVPEPPEGLGYPACDPARIRFRVSPYLCGKFLVAALGIFPVTAMEPDATNTTGLRRRRAGRPGNRQKEG